MSRRPDIWASAATTSRRDARRCRRRRPLDRRVGALGWTLVTAVATAALGATAGTATAGWTSTGAGAATGVVADTQVAATVTGVQGLYPGGPGVASAVTIANPGNTPFHVTGVTPAASSPDDACPAASVAVDAPADLPVVPATGTAVVTVVLALTAGAPEECQGAVLGLSVAVEGRWE